MLAASNSEANARKLPRVIFSGRYPYENTQRISVHNPNVLWRPAAPYANSVDPSSPKIRIVLVYSLLSFSGSSDKLSCFFCLRVAIRIRFYFYGVPSGLRMLRYSG